MRQAGYTIEVHFNYARQILERHECYTPERALALVPEMNKEYDTNLRVQHAQCMEATLGSAIERLAEAIESLKT